MFMWEWLREFETLAVASVMESLNGSPIQLVSLSLIMSEGFFKDCFALKDCYGNISSYIFSKVASLFTNKSSNLTLSTDVNSSNLTLPLARSASLFSVSSNSIYWVASLEMFVTEA